MNEQDLKTAAKAIRENNKAVLLAHRSPDGDAIGAMLAFALMLKKKGFEVACSWPGPFRLHEKYGFLPGKEMIVEPERIAKEGIVITLDCASMDRLEEMSDICKGAPEILNFDHHPDNTMYGTANFVDPGAAATSEIVYRVAGDLGLEVDLEAALCLYVGIVTDTGRFQYANTSWETLRVASEIVRMGVEPMYVYRNVYQGGSIRYLRLTARVLENAVYEEDTGLVYGTVTQSEFAGSGVGMEETEDLIDELRSLKGHSVAALFKELPGGEIRVSLRSNSDLDVGVIARRFGGGGHRAAAGYTNRKPGGLEEALTDLRKEICARRRSTCS